MKDLNLDYKRYIEKNDTIKQINDWYKKDKDKILTIVTTPYNTFGIFKTIMHNLFNQSLKILYISNNLAAFNQNIKGTFNGINNNDLEKFMDIVDAKDISDINDFYELIIYDDISYFSEKNSKEIQIMLNYLYNKCNKMILYSVEKVINNSKVIEMCNYLRKTPFNEPRIITTRIDLTKDIPYIMYDYLKWFKENNRKVIIHSPSKEMVDIIYEYFIKTLKISEIRILKAKSKKEYNFLKYIEELKDKSLMIITDYIGDYLQTSKDIDIIVYFADQKFFNYKKLLYLCGKISMSLNGQGEILLIGQSLSDDMEKVKNISRDFNKHLWEKGLLGF